jgi:chromosome partitioning protein
MTAQTLRAASFLDKGGTGKTTAVAHLGVAMAELGHDVLLIDLAGKQGDLVKHFGEWTTVQDEIDTDDDWPNISTVFDETWEKIADKLGDQAVDDLIIETDEGPDLIPAHPGLDSLDAELGNIDDAHERYSRLDDFLTEYIGPLGYDVVLIDLPGLTNNVSYNGLWAAQNVFAPVEMGPFESEQARALEDDLDLIADKFGIGVQLVMVLPNKLDSRTKLSEEYLDDFETTYPDSIASQPIPMSQDIRNAADRGQTAFELENPSTTAKRAQEAFLTNAEELVDQLRRNAQ